MNLQNTEVNNSYVARIKGQIPKKLILFEDSERIKKILNKDKTFGLINERDDECARWVSLDGIILGVNDSFYKLYEMNPDEIIGKPIHCINEKGNDEELNELITLYKRNLLKTNINYYFKKFVVTKNGKSLFLEGINTFVEITDLNGSKPGTVLLSIFKNSSGEKTHISEISKSIIAGSQPNEADIFDLNFNKNDDTYRTLVETSPDAIFLLDLDGNILMCNKRTASILGFENIEEMHQKNIFSLVAPEDSRRLNRDARRLIQSGILENIEYSVITKSSDVLAVEINASIVLDLMGKPEKIVTIMRDISKRKKAEAQLQSAEKFAAIGRQAAVLAHEIKTPLASIKMNIDMLFNNIELTDTKQRSVRIIQKEMQRLVKLLKNILLFSRELNFVFLNVDLGKLVYNIESLMQPVLDEHKIIFRNNLHNVKIKGDYRNLQTLFLHLIENSIEAMPDGGEINIYSTINNDGSLSVFFKDTGCGISDDIKIFDPFFTTKSSGTGLGLAIVKNIIRQHNGDIKLIKSVKGNTTFEIIFNNNTKV